MQWVPWEGTQKTLEPGGSVEARSASSFHLAKLCLQCLLGMPLKHLSTSICTARLSMKRWMGHCASCAAFTASNAASRFAAAVEWSMLWTRPPRAKNLGGAFSTATDQAARLLNCFLPASPPSVPTSANWKMACLVRMASASSEVRLRLSSSGSGSRRGRGERMRPVSNVPDCSWV